MLANSRQALRRQSRSWDRHVLGASRLVLAMTRGSVMARRASLARRGTTYCHCEGASAAEAIPRFAAAWLQSLIAPPESEMIRGAEKLAGAFSATEIATLPARTRRLHVMVASQQRRQNLLPEAA